MTHHVQGLAGDGQGPQSRHRRAAQERAGGDDGVRRSMGKAALAPGALDSKTKELLALAISVAVRCEPCITYHASAAQRQGATRRRWPRR